MVGTHTDFLVRIEAHADIAVCNLLMVAQIAHRLDNLSDTGLVISTQERGAIRYDQVFTLVFQQFRELGGTRHDTFREHDIPSVIVLDDARFDICAAGIGRCVIMGDKADGGHLLLRVGFQRGIDVTVLVHLHIRKTFVFEFFLQVFGKHKLFRRTRHTFGVFSRLCVKLCVV